MAWLDFFRFYMEMLESATCLPKSICPGEEKVFDCSRNRNQVLLHHKQRLGNILTSLMKSKLKTGWS